ncbi:hypothetical protein BD779DRAFT_1146546 [Infundibulicybe gibba]|nr:hypothetical protein BD779DRAFT_1146546 [Infundibulicybe gibba]
MAPHQDDPVDAPSPPTTGADAEAADHHKRHILTRRITEEDLTHFPPTDGNSSDEDGPGDVQVVENPRFGGKASNASTSMPSSPISPGFGKRFSLRTPAGTKSDMGAGSSLAMGSSSSVPSLGKRERKASIGPRFFGSIRGLFRGQQQQKEPPSVTGGGALTPPRGGGGKWETRTEKNLKGLSSADSDVGGINSQVPRSNFHTLVEASTAMATPPKARKRLLSDATETVSPSRPGERGGRRLKKERSTKHRKTRSASVPPAGSAKDNRLGINSPSTGNLPDNSVGADDPGIKRAAEWLDGQDLLAQKQQALDAELVIAERVNGTKKKASTKNSPDASEPEKGWASDGGATATGSGSGDASVTRRKSKKAKPLVMVLDADGKAAVASGSIVSTASAPAALSKTSKSSVNRRASMGSNLPPTPPLPAHLVGQSSVIITRRGMSVDDGSPTPASKSKTGLGAAPAFQFMQRGQRIARANLT